ncbi:Amino acid transporter AVT1C [Camellia lanceoleosa]|uniref:Amino acid transporter AVT1C n=1 Tax=Camellia lanceoleosa TaxID=1840588 RepID=A0ACC0FUY8_9ERIC|nr:Amino acid transporter AVT1C [Camellia lanceoleosa]
MRRRNLTRRKMMETIWILRIIRMKIGSRANPILSIPHGLKVTGNQLICIVGYHPRVSHFLALTPTLSRLSSSLLSSSLTRRHTPEILPSVAKPLLPTVDDEQQPQQRRSSHSLLPPIPSRKASTKKLAKVSHEVPAPHHSSFGQAVLNGMNVLCGVGILSTPYAVKEGGWVGLSILFIFAVLSFYTGILLRECLDSQPGLETYPDIGQAAFGNMGRFAISVSLVGF